MHEFWTVPTVDMTYIRSQKHTNVLVCEHETNIEPLVDGLLFSCCCHLMILSPQVRAHPHGHMLNVLASRFLAPKRFVSGLFT